ncbi:hypothetical protein L1987_67668 [Smallanthus sonchifolius]|uniref:Uncharacterized protein n=1 Tax=Smallanthus sonchifolius TaxID=185202 RepID=A0ACB9B3I4_9ASTR|nr:hypothetical protein L1987_67668 [Smallanthus sonchifolius]
MQKLTKPTSSPGRTDKFPPPLMRFLRNNVGSKSRRRSRASPMFLRKKNTPIETTQEPSSPKVTCIGQVRVRRSNKTTTTTSQHRRRNRCLRNFKPRSCHNLWSKCLSFFRICKNPQDSHVSPHEQDQDQDHVREVEHVTLEPDDVNQGLIVSKSPPKNVFLLTRCRSAPYRSSSLANIFRESTMGEEEEVVEKFKKLNIEKEEEEEVVEVENGEVSEEGGTCNGGEELKAVPLILSRCKSEPARTWDQLLV